jgi:hypothetical protein
MRRSRRLSGHPRLMHIRQTLRRGHQLAGVALGNRRGKTRQFQIGRTQQIAKGSEQYQRIPGIIAFRMRAAVRPFISGIERSSTIRSGLSSCAIAIASCPLEASPQTAQPASSNIRRMLLLTTALSSAKRICFTYARFPVDRRTFRGTDCLSLVISGYDSRPLHPRMQYSTHCTLPHTGNLRSS